MIRFYKRLKPRDWRNVSLCNNYPIRKKRPGILVSFQKTIALSVVTRQAYLVLKWSVLPFSNTILSDASQKLGFNQLCSSKKRDDRVSLIGLVCPMENFFYCQYFSGDPTVFLIVWYHIRKKNSPTLIAAL